MRVFVTGVKGQLGHDVMNELAKRGHEGIGVDIEEMDITDAESVRKVITEANPDVVIHCAAWTAANSLVCASFEHGFSVYGACARIRSIPCSLL